MFKTFGIQNIQGFADLDQTIFLWIGVNENSTDRVTQDFCRFREHKFFLQNHIQINQDCGVWISQNQVHNDPDCPHHASWRKPVLNFAESGGGNIGLGTLNTSPDIGTILEIFAQFSKYQQILSQFEITTNRLFPAPHWLQPRAIQRFIIVTCFEIQPVSGISGPFWHFIRLQSFDPLLEVDMMEPARTSW